MQILGLAPTAKRWLDIGSGAGFPGLVIAAQLKGIADAEVHCVESDKRKCAFLAHVIRETGIPAVVHSTRVEDLASRAIMPIDAVTSRAVASLPKLLQLSREYIDRGATGIFPRGRTYKETIKILEASGAYSINVIESSTASDSGLICIQSRLVQKP
jgi:16S rRNA (guanine527-N7)-methyltransferase